MDGWLERKKGRREERKKKGKKGRGNKDTCRCSRSSQLKFRGRGLQWSWHSVLSSCLWLVPVCSSPPISVVGPIPHQLFWMNPRWNCSAPESKGSRLQSCQLGCWSLIGW